jgi:hypothetical protein
MSCPHDPRQNHLLSAVPAEEYARCFPNLELVPMPLGDVLYESGSELRHVYFPTTSIVSLLYVMLDGASAEIAVVGNEDIIGVALFMAGLRVLRRGQEGVRSPARDGTHSLIRRVGAVALDPLPAYRTARQACSVRYRPDNRQGSLQVER